MTSRRGIAVVFALAVGFAARDAAGQQLTVGPQQLQFGDQAVNTTSPAQSITVTNVGPPITLGAALIANADAKNFTAENGCFNRYLATGESCSIAVSFAPLRSGSMEAQLLVRDYTNTVVLRGTATGATPTHAVPRYEATVVDTGGFPPGDVFVTGFNNDDTIAGFVTYYPERWCGHDGYNVSAFVISDGPFTELRHVPGSPLIGIGEDGCPLSSMSIGVDDAGEVFGFAPANGLGTPESFRYADGIFSGIPSPPGDWADFGVTADGVVFHHNSWGYFADGQFVSLDPPPDLDDINCGVFHAASRTWINVRDFCGLSEPPSHVETLSGFSFGRVSTGPGLSTATVYRNGVFTDIGYQVIPGALGGLAVNSAGQLVVEDSPSNPELLYWDRHVGLQRLNDLLPAGWTATRRPFTRGGVARIINDNGHILAYARDASNVEHLVILTPRASMPTGDNIVTQLGATTLTFTSVTSSGTTTVDPIDAGTAGTVPGGFAISETMAYQITTTATFSGPVTLAFVVPGTWSEAEFNNLRVLHNENGSLVDITTSYDYSRLTIYATTSSFSPFYIARRGLNISPLFDTTRAYRASSTVPMKLQVRDASGANVSAPDLQVTARKLLRLGASTALEIADSGHSNPDGDFRFDPSLGATGGYIFNLNTRGLTAGRYSLSVSVGGDKTFIYTVSFEIR